MFRTKIDNMIRKFVLSHSDNNRTTSDGHVIWFKSNGQLMCVDPKTGAIVTP